MSFTAFPQEDEVRPVRIEGRLIDKKQEPVPFAHIINLNRDVGTISDIQGFFGLGSYPGDTIAISAISYGNLVYIVPELTEIRKYYFELVMDHDTIMLREQVIYPWPESFDELSKEILEMRTNDTVAQVFQGDPWFRPGELTNEAYPQGGIRIQGPLGLLYGRFSKEAKTARQLDNNILLDKIRLRYNPELITKITGLTDKVEINRLIAYCNLRPEFILKANDYDLYSAIYQCYMDYRASGYE